MIPTSGPPGNLMIIGDYPTSSELAAEKAFSASVGSLFNRLLQPHKKKMSDIYGTYLIKQAVPGYASPVRKKREEAWSDAWNRYDWGKLIKEEISSIRPNCIIGFGEKTLNFLTGEKKITQHRGSILNIYRALDYNTSDDKGVKLVPILSPRDIFTENFHPFNYTQWDVGRAIKYSNYQSPFKDTSNVWIVRSVEELSNWWDRGKYGEFLTLDIETHYGFITCIGFSHDGKEAISIPLLVGNKWDYQSRGMVYRLIREVLSHRIPKVNQNIKYDWRVIERYGLSIQNIIGDTMLLAHTIYPEYPKGLDFLTSIYTETPYYKDEGKNFDPRLHSYDRLLLYNGKDCITAWNIWKSQIEDAKYQKVWDFFQKKVWPTFFIYKKSDERGIRVDDERRKKLLAKYEPLLYHNNLPLRLLARNSEFNPESPAQVGKFLYEVLGIKKRTHTTNSGNLSYSTDKKTLEGILIKDTLDAGQRNCIQRILFARQLGTVIGFLNVVISRDGRIRQSSKLQGTETGRTSASEALEERFILGEKGKIEHVKSGWSFQTIPKHGFYHGLTKYGDDLRTIFVPSPGYVIIDGDQSQAEARVVCVLSEDWETLELFGKIDIHKFTASLVLRKPIEFITKEERQFQGKVTRHAGNYNESAGGLMQRTHKPFKECLMTLEAFHSGVPKVRGVFHTQIRHFIDKQRYLVSPSERRRDFFGMVNEDMYKEAFATIPQATVSDHNKQTVMVEMDRKWAGRDCHIFCESHDSLSFEVPREMKEEFAADFKQTIATPINFSKCTLRRDFDLVIPGEIQIGESDWGTMEDWKG